MAFFHINTCVDHWSTCGRDGIKEYRRSIGFPWFRRWVMLYWIWAIRLVRQAHHDTIPRADELHGDLLDRGLSAAACLQEVGSPEAIAMTKTVPMEATDEQYNAMKYVDENTHPCLERYRTMYRAAIEAAPEAEWIAVGDVRKPERHDWVWTIYFDGVIFPCRFKGTFDADVTHWQPITKPNPPKEPPQ